MERHARLVAAGASGRVVLTARPVSVYRGKPLAERRRQTGSQTGSITTWREAPRSACREARSYIMVIMRSYSKAYMFLSVFIRYHMLYVYN